MTVTDPLALPAWEPVAAVDDLGPGLAIPVDGTPLWWVSRDVDLRPSAAAAVCLLAPWCALRGQPLAVPAVDRTFAGNVAAATRLMGSWWGHEAVQMPAAAGLAPAWPAPRPAATALFFSGGIDSFYTLVNNSGVGALVYIVGFDVRLRNRPAWEAMCRAWRRVAGELGIRFIAVTTNLRDHPVLGQMRWARYHGAVLASAAHLLGDVASHWLVSASYHVSNLMPWGSHPELDHLWSGDGIGIRHYGADVWRAEKLAALAGVPLVHRELRVCYDDPRAEGNCGRCEKCVRTRLIYWQDLPGITCAHMPAQPDLAEALRRMPPLPMRTLVRIYARFLERAPPGDPVTIALNDLIIRSGGAGTT